MDGEEDKEDEAENGQRHAKKIQDPKLPSEEEIKQHEITHLPYRSWCRHCVRGRGREFPHARVGDQVSLPELHATCVSWATRARRGTR